jgi:hypothetical protein
LEPPQIEPISHDMPRGSPWLAWRET